jgi:Holliday junction DNA helicase RuvB
MSFRMQFYSSEELAKIITQAANKLSKEIVKTAAIEISKRSRGTPRIALRLLRRVRDFADVADELSITHNTTTYALDELGINSYGFDEMDIRLLNLLVAANGRAMGLSTIAAALSEDEGTVEDVLEPYLIANGYLERTAKGRRATRATYDVLNMAYVNADGTLF